MRFDAIHRPLIIRIVLPGNLSIHPPREQSVIVRDVDAEERRMEDTVHSSSFQMRREIELKGRVFKVRGDFVWSQEFGDQLSSKAFWERYVLGR